MTLACAFDRGNDLVLGCPESSGKRQHDGRIGHPRAHAAVDPVVGHFGDRCPRQDLITGQAGREAQRRDRGLSRSSSSRSSGATSSTLARSGMKCGRGCSARRSHCQIRRPLDAPIFTARAFWERPAAPRARANDSPSNRATATPLRSATPTHPHPTGFVRGRLEPRQTRQCRDISRRHETRAATPATAIGRGAGAFPRHVPRTGRRHDRHAAPS